MNENVRIITDSGCDISPESEKEWENLLVVMPFTVNINGKDYLDRIDIQPDEFYKILKENQEIPKHSQITQMQFEEKYRELYEQGVREIIVDVINAAGSQTFNQAKIAANAVKEDLPDLKIYTVDSQNYSLAYGYPVLEACRKLSEGQTVESVVDYLEDWAKHSMATIVGFDLRHMKKSGIKPIIMLHDSVTEVVKKARGEKAALDAGVEEIAKNIIPETPYSILTTTRPELEKEFIAKITKKMGYPPALVEKCGVVVSCNAGPEFIGILFKGNR